MSFKVLGIETSCDETAAAVVDVANRQILSNAVHSQNEHIDYGGVVPEIAARAHLERLPHMVQKALDDANLKLEDIDGIAATAGPGLLGGLLVGLSFAKSLALGAEKSLLATNHLEGHALTAHLTDSVEFPYLLLLVSGGHCQFINVHGIGSYEELGGTLDDAVGECFDKSAKLLGLPWPGGPHIEKLAAEGDPNAIAFPLPLNDKSLNFSFSGLKTAVRNHIQKTGELTEDLKADIAASLQKTIADLLILKVGHAMDQTGASRFVLAGGVAANKLLRAQLENLCNQKSIQFCAPPIHLCTDNAVMIAYAGGLRLAQGEASSFDAKAVPRWPLSELEEAT